MAVMKCILGLLVLFAVSAWTGAEDTDPTVTEQLENANKDFGRIRDGYEVNGDIAVPRTFTRNADPCIRTGCLWPRAGNGRVYIPYAIAPRQYSQRELDIIQKGIDSFAYSTCIYFYPRRNERDYLYIQSLQGCYSFVGRQGNAQTVSLSRNGCIYHGTVQHELLHALGFNHEQCRSDRDQHIRILEQNILKGQAYNFNKINTLNQGTPYDYDSVMHYGRLAFSKDNRSPTMVAYPNSRAVFGEAQQMSQNDIKRINLLYCKN